MWRELNFLSLNLPSTRPHTPHSLSLFLVTVDHKIESQLESRTDSQSMIKVTRKVKSEDDEDMGVELGREKESKFLPPHQSSPMDG